MVVRRVSTKYGTFPIEQRHRMHFIADSYILYSDLREFVQFTESASLIEIEHLLFVSALSAVHAA
jgi:hypothetical protein